MNTARGKLVDVFWTRLSGLPMGWTISSITASLGVLVAIAQFNAGVRLSGPGAAHDGAFAVWSFMQFRGDLAFGYFPRWSHAGFNGLGSPLFYFYPPGAFYAATLIGLLAPAVQPADVIALTEILFRILAVCTCFAWLRLRTSPAQALFGAGLYVLMPWVSIFDPQVRLAFAETAAIAVLPLTFLAVDLGKDRPPRLFLGIAVTTGLLTVIHLPSLVANSGVLLAYAALAERSLRSAIRSTLTVIVGVGFGLASAGYTLIPALGLLSKITSSALWDAEHRPEGNYFLAVASFHSPIGILLNICLLAPVLLVAIVSGRGLPVGRISIGIVGSLGVACFFLLPVSSLFWTYLLPLRMVQFPGRFMPTVSLLASAIVALSLGECRMGVQRLVVGTVWAMGLCALAFAVSRGDAASPGLKRTADAISDPRANAPEYVPEAAGSKGWFELMADPTAFAEQLGKVTSLCVSRMVEERRATRRQNTFDVSRCTGSVVLPVLFFPGWTAQSDNGQQLAMRADDKSGLIMIDVLPQAKRITLGRSQTQIETVGVLTSLLSIGILTLLSYILLSGTAAPAGACRRILARIPRRK